MSKRDLLTLGLRVRVEADTKRFYVHQGGPSVHELIEFVEREHGLVSVGLLVKCLNNYRCEQLCFFGFEGLGFRV